MTILTVYDAYYTVESDGYVQDTPVVHLIGRDEDRQYRHVRVDDFEPYFCVRQSEAIHETGRLQDDERIRYVETTDERTVTGEYVARIVTRLPEHVPKFREGFDETYEADVRFPQRFLIDQGIRHQATVAGDPEAVLSVEQVTSADDGDVAPTPPRKCTYDIEVEQSDEGPSVVSERGTTLARQSITSIAAHDSYTDDYHLWVLAHPSWGQAEADLAVDVVEDADVHVTSASVHEDESSMLTSVCSWLADRRFNVLQGWNCLPEGTPVLMADGSEKAIENVNVGDDIVGIDGEESSVGIVQNTVQTGTKETLDIDTQNGYSLTCSREHRVLVGNEDDVHWKRAKDVVEGDYVLTPKNLPSDESHGELPFGPYQLGLVATDGSVSRDDGVRFYNTDKALHDAFDSGNQLVELHRGGYSQRVFGGPRDEVADQLSDVGFPIGDRREGTWDLSPIHNCDEATIARFLAGVVDGDGTVDHTVSIGSEQDGFRYWLMRLFRRLGIVCREHEDGVHLCAESLDRFKELVLPYIRSEHKVDAAVEMECEGSGLVSTIPPIMATKDREKDGRTGFRAINDKIRRGINVKRWEAREVGSPMADAYEDFLFSKVTGIEDSAHETCYDLDTSLDSFVADDIVVHNSNAFDTPYLVNRCIELDVDTLHDISPTGYVSPMSGDGSWLNSDLKGVVCFDLLDGYKKTQYRELDSYSLSHVAAAETDLDKLEVGDIDELWREDPERFVSYNLRDTVATVAIDETVGVV